MDWACNVSAYTDGRKNILKNTALIFLHELDFLFVALDEGTAYRIEDIAEVELSAVNADDVESSFYLWVQNYGNPVLVRIVVVELSVLEHSVPFTRSSLDDRLHIC
jgi:hypothetical protein